MGIYGPKSAAKIDLRAVSETMQPVVAEWYNAVIELVKPDITGGAFDRANNTKERTPEIFWSGPARIQAMRWPNVATARQEAVSARTVVFHLPLSTDLDPKLVHEGWRIKVLDGGMAPEFEGGLFVITGAVNSSYAWDRRIETIMDQGTTID